MNRSAALVVLISLLAGAATACGRKEPAVAPPPTTTQPAAPSIDVAVEPETPRAPPSVIVFVDGGPDDKTLWRGWPVLVHVAILQGDAPMELTIRGPSAVTPERRGRIWVLPPAASRQMADGAYTFSVGAGSREVAVSDPPPVLTPEQGEIHRRLSAYADLALGNTDGAKKAAREWVAADPESVEAQTVLGDALSAAGDVAGAEAAYEEAIRLVPPGVHPPASLLARAGGLWRGKSAALPAKPVDPDETEFYQRVGEAAAAVESGDRAGAERHWSAADALHRDRRLRVSRYPLEQLRAAMDALPAAPKKPDAPKGEPAIVPKKPDAAIVEPPVAPKKPDGAKVGPPSAGSVVPASELTDEKIRADAAGQWAASAVSGSQYDKKQYSAAKATGAPDVSVVGNSPDAWCPASKDRGTDWLELGFATPVHAVELRVRQNDAAGAITRIEALEPDGTAHLWWEGVDPLVAKGAREIVWFVVRVPKTPYLVAKAKVTLNLASGPGWKEIDAVQLVAAPE